MPSHDKHESTDGNVEILTKNAPLLPNRRISALCRRLYIRKVYSGQILALEGHPAQSLIVSIDAHLLTYRGLDASVAVAFELKAGRKLVPPSPAKGMQVRDSRHQPSTTRPSHGFEVGHQH